MVRVVRARAFMPPVTAKGIRHDDGQGYDGGETRWRPATWCAWRRPNRARRLREAALDPAARERIAATRAYIDRTWMHDDAPLMYAFNTGVGLFKDQRVLIADMAAYQRKTVYAHATGVGEPFARGRDAGDDAPAGQRLRVELFRAAGRARRAADRLPQCRPAPGHPAKGLGRRLRRSCAARPHGRRGVRLRGGRDGLQGPPDARPARPSPRRVSQPDFELGAKDASALINGSTTSLALAVLATHDARRLLKHADIAMCLSLEAMRGELAAFDPRLHQARPHPGQAQVARNLLRILDGTKRCSRRPPRRGLSRRAARARHARAARACRTSIRCAARRRSTARPGRRSSMSSASSATRSTPPPTTR